MAKSLNPRNISSFCFRHALEIEHQRGVIFNLLRLADKDLPRNHSFMEANSALYRAHCALIDAQRVLDAIPLIHPSRRKPVRQSTDWRRHTRGDTEETS